MERKERDKKERKKIEKKENWTEDLRRDFQIEVAPSEFLTTLDDVSRIMSHNKGVIRGARIA